MTERTKLPRHSLEQAIRLAIIVLVIAVLSSAVGNIVFHFTELHW
jgi:type III secretory pathway component EscS